MNTGSKPPEFEAPELKAMDPALEQAVNQIREDAVDEAVVEAAADRVWANLAAQYHAPLRTCEDFQALLPEFKSGQLAPARALLVSVGGELRNVFPCELENGYVEPEDFLESLLKREPWAVGGVERRKRVKRHDRLADHLAANPDLLEPGLILRGKEIPVSGESGSVDRLFLDRAGRWGMNAPPIEADELLHGVPV